MKNAQNQKTISRYTIVKRIASGASGTVYEAKETSTGNRCALKVLGEGDHSKKGEAQLVREFTFLASLNHPNLVKVLDFGTDKFAGHHIVMEYVPGVPITGFFKRVKVDEVTVVLRQVLDALDYMHRAGFLHGDIKPGHILVAESEDHNPFARVIDLGLAHRHEEGAQSDAVGGTAGYIAPEIFCGGLPDGRSDLYSLGVVAYEVLTKRLPFIGDDLLATFRAQLSENPPSPAMLNAAIPQWLSEFVIKLISKDPADRFASARVALLHIADETGSRLTSQREAAGTNDLLGPSFVGREEHLGRMMDSYMAPAPERAGLHFIHGEEGVGKTRFLRELGFKLKLEGADVVFLPGSTPHAKVLFADLLRQLKGLLGFDASEFPHLQRVLGHTASGKHESAEVAKDAREQKMALFEELLDVLREKPATEQPIALLVDDLDKAPATFVEFVRHLSRSLEDLPGVVVYSASTGALALADDSRQRPVTVRLRGLDEDTTGRFVASMFGEVTSSNEVNRELVRLTGGNPLFLQETIRAMASTGVLRVEKGVWSLKAGRAVECTTSAMLENVLKRRIAALPVSEKRVLRAASVLGPSFEVFLLKKTCGIRRIETIWKRLATLSAQDLLFEIEDGHFSFRHVVCQQLVYRGIEEKERRRLHRLAASSISKARGGALGLSQLMGHHLAEAGMFEQALPWLLKAADEAVGTFCTHEASVYLSRALSIWPESDRKGERYWRAKLELADAYSSLGQAADAASLYEQVWDNLRDSLSSEERVVLSRSRGLALGSTGDANEALQWYDRVRKEIGALSPANEAALLNSIGMAHFSAGDYSAARQRFEKAAGLLEGIKCSELSRTYRNLAIVSHAQDDLDGAVALARRSIEVANDIGDAREKAHTRISLGILLGVMQDTRAAIDEYLEALEFFKPRRDLEALACIYNNLGSEYELEGDLQNSLKARKEAFAVAKRIDDRMAGIYAFRGLGKIHIALGEWEVAAREYSESLRLAELTGAPRQRAVSLLRIAHLQTLKGDLDDARVNTRTSLALLQDAGDEEDRLFATILSSMAHRQVGDLKASEKLAEEALSIAEELGLSEERIRAAIELAYALCESGNPDKADRVFAKHVSEPLRGGRELLCASGLRLLCEVRLGQDRVPEAKAAATQAKVISERLGAVYEISLANLLLAKVAYLEKDYREAKLLLDGTLSALKPLGAKPDIARADELSRKLEEVEVNEGQLSADLTLIYEMSQIFNSMLGLEELLSRVMDYVLQRVSAERGIILLKDETTQKLEVVIARNVDKMTLKDVSEVSNSIVSRVMSRGEALVSTNAMHDPRFKSKQSIMLNRIRSLMCVPLTIRADIVGTIYVDNRITAGIFSQDDVKFLTSFSNYVAMAVDRSKMYARLQAEREKLATENVELRKRAEMEFSFDSILGSSSVMQGVFDLMRLVVPTSATVLILGKSGTGKELVARAIHYNGPRKDKPFVKVNCATLPENLLESELFGHEKGAYTGADQRKIGKFELADTGTVFLDEITEIKPSLQAKLLQVIEEKRFERVGGTKQIAVDVRILAASNRDIQREIDSGNFRDDLYFRLCEVPIRLPELKKRQEDIPLLVEHFVSLFAEELGKGIKGIEKEAMARLQAYDWPGNVRELKHTIYRAMLSCDATMLDLDDIVNVLPGSPLDEQEPTLPTVAARSVIRESREIAESDSMLKRARTVFEGALMREALKEARHNISEASRRLGLNRKTFRSLLREYDVEE